ncbi:glycosyltransferase family 10 [Polynucleobacter sp. MWH-UH23A]|uniref:glycosyltransferase family 10 domain-containing protein n=1 Tax=Polynucleobacter sp. MWH-UH23A TaxID=1855613 RepID=UPI00336528F6
MPKLKPFKLAAQGVAKDFQTSLFPAILRSLGYEPVWTNLNNCSLLIVGPFLEEKKRFNWVPKPFRSAISKSKNGANHQNRKHQGPPTLLITGENVRHDFQKCDFAISFDLGVIASNHFRMPYWMEMVDWSHEGVTGNLNPRYGCLLSLERLLQPLGNDFLARPQKAAIFASHLREPRQTLLNIVKKHIEVIQYGRTFDSKIKNHLESGIVKYDELKRVAFNLCPENGMYPGYYTEKIPEAFMAGCLPITWADENVKADFNPNAFINLAPMSYNNFAGLNEILHSQKLLSAYANETLLLKKPSLDQLKIFIKDLIDQVLS